MPNGTKENDHSERMLTAFSMLRKKRLKEQKTTTRNAENIIRLKSQKAERNDNSTRSIQK